MSSVTLPKQADIFQPNSQLAKCLEASETVQLMIELVRFQIFNDLINGDPNAKAYKMERLLNLYSNTYINTNIFQTTVTSELWFHLCWHKTKQVLIYLFSISPSLISNKYWSLSQDFINFCLITLYFQIS